MFCENACVSTGTYKNWRRDTDSSNHAHIYWAKSGRIPTYQVTLVSFYPTWTWKNLEKHGKLVTMCEIDVRSGRESWSRYLRYRDKTTGYDLFALPPAGPSCGSCYGSFLSQNAMPYRPYEENSQIYRILVLVFNHPCFFLHTNAWNSPQLNAID